MVSVKFYPLDIDVSPQGMVRLFGKTSKGKRICVLDNSFKAFFYVLPEGSPDLLMKRMARLSFEDKDREYVVTNTEIVEKMYCNEKVNAVRVEVNHPRALKLVKEEIQSELIILEDDVDIITKYLVDREITPLVICEVEGDYVSIDGHDSCIEGEVKQKENAFYEKPRILSFDIEVSGNSGVESKDKKDPVIMIAFYGERYEKVITWKKSKKKYVEQVDSEAGLIERFVEIIHEYQPDYLVSYFGDGYDLPYLKSRGEKYGIDLDLGLDSSNVKFKRGGLSNTAKIVGIPHLDVFKFVRRTMATTLKLDSYSLNNVAQHLLGEKKEDMDFESLMKKWEEGKIDEIVSYNLQDTRLTYNLFKKILPNLNELVRLIGIPIFEISRMSYGTLVEHYLIKRAKEFNVIMPSKPGYGEIMDRREESYQGAFVMEPIPGLYKDIVVLDYRSLYPSIIIAKNIDPSMLKSDSNEAYATPEIVEEGKKIKYYFNYKEDGFIPSVMKDLILRRNRIKEMIKGDKNNVLRARSESLKLIANSCYGMYGFFGSRFYSNECASSITAFARGYIQDTIKKAKDEGFLVIYSDTDSIAMSLQSKKKSEAKQFLEDVNKELPSLMELEMEDFYPLGIFVAKKGDTKGAKKKYALITAKDEMKVIGFETVRRDWSLIARETQMRVLELILKERSHEKAIKYVKEVIDKIRNKKISVKKMVMASQIKRKLEDYVQIGPHVSAARRMKKKGKAIGIGSTVLFVVTEGKGPIRDRVKLPEECKVNEYDSAYYINNQMIPSVEKIFEVFDVKKEDLLGKDQSKLGDF